MFTSPCPLLVCLVSSVLFLPFSVVHARKVEIPSSFNPVGSGARAIGMGGAFIAVADDATAASWNPGGLIQLRKPETSLVGSCLWREEENTFRRHPEGNGTHRIHDGNLNYFSAAYPFECAGRNMVFSLNYQHLFDFDRDWRFVLREEGTSLSCTDQWDFQQDGDLTALGFSYCIQIVPQLSVGFTLNLWDDDLTENSWEQRYRIKGSGMLGTMPFTSDYYRKNAYSFEGINANLGFLWIVNRKLTVGGVLKTPFTADIGYRRTESYIEDYPLFPDANTAYEYSGTGNDELEMPMSYGIGVLWQVSNVFSLSADIYKTHWDQFTYRNQSGEKISPVTGRPRDRSHVDTTCQVRLGAEYLIINRPEKYVIPLRCGVFYDPAPSEGSPDDIFGCSLGAGYTQNDRFSFDMAYQYRSGNDVGNPLFYGAGFSQDIEEHKVCVSFILYWRKPFRKKLFEF
ncbi:MAG: hypothetical protein CSB33_04715 [Desulfobacterales bacterium]|nr:MAG: hypothetical protein CSB33_04715 [Desulfobacterales bacterium]